MITKDPNIPHKIEKNRKMLNAYSNTDVNNSQGTVAKRSRRSCVFINNLLMSVKVKITPKTCKYLMHLYQLRRCLLFWPPCRMNSGRLKWNLVTVKQRVHFWAEGRHAKISVGQTSDTKAQYTPPTPTRRNCRGSSRRRCEHNSQLADDDCRRIRSTI